MIIERQHENLDCQENSCSLENEDSRYKKHLSNILKTISSCPLVTLCLDHEIFSHESSLMVTVDGEYNTKTYENI